MLRESVAANRRRLESGESLLEDERRIFALVKQAAEAHAPPVVARAAGGWVRDKLLGLESDDLDIALENCSGIEFARHLGRFADVKIHANPEQSQHLETAKVIIFGSLPIDLCQLRCDEYAAGSRIPTVRVGTAREDTVRRDFTVNGLYFNINDGAVEDFSTGIADLSNSILRTMVDPVVSFSEDPLRILRAFRFAPRFDFTIDDQIFEASRQNLGVFKEKVRRERAEKEVEKSLTGRNPLTTIECYLRTGLFPLIFDRMGVWNLDESLVLERVAFANRRLSNCKCKYAIVLAAIYFPLFGAQFVEDPANRKKRIHPIECAATRHLCAPAVVGQTAIRLLRGANTALGLFHEAVLTRVTAGRWLREVGEIWTETRCVMFDEVAADWFDATLVPFVEGEQLDGVWNLKPLVGGKELAAIHAIRPGPDIVRATAELIDWQLEHPQGTVDDYRRALGK